MSRISSKPQLLVFGTCNLVVVYSLDILHVSKNLHSQDVCRHFKKVENHGSNDIFFLFWLFKSYVTLNIFHDKRLFQVTCKLIEL